MIEKIRNFCIIAHIDHGKSTLADRFLEITGTIDKRKMRSQFLDQLDLERERGVTIKMAPVRMIYRLNGSEHILNLIDTPGHSDFSYEVSRSLAAVEGVILLVDATQGIQAQTLANFQLAKKAGLKVIGAVNKIDLSPAQLDEAIKDLAELLNQPKEAIYKISGKTGVGVEELLTGVIKNVPCPQKISLGDKECQALIFDSFYDDHQGIVASVRVFGGSILSGEERHLVASKTNFKVKEVGYFSPVLKPAQILKEGEIGYVATGVKDPDKLKIGDTIGDKPLAGYKEPQAVVFVSFYPEDTDQYEELKRALQKLKLNDSALRFDADYNEVLGRGFKVGFLGRFHFEITAERLEREFKVKTVQSFPSVVYQVVVGGKTIEVSNPQQLPEEYEEISEPVIRIEIITPAQYLGRVLQIKELFRVFKVETQNFGDRMIVIFMMPLSDFIEDFDEKLKSMTEGFASFSYELVGYERGDLVKVDILVAGDPVPGLTRLLPKESAEYEGRTMIKKLKDLLPKQQFVQALQAAIGGKIIARENIPALKKDVTGYLYGGDRTRKMKLWKKQQRGKQRLKESARVTVPPSAFKELLKR